MEESLRNSSSLASYVLNGLLHCIAMLYTLGHIVYGPIRVFQREQCWHFPLCTVQLGEANSFPSVATAVKPQWQGDMFGPYERIDVGETPLSSVKST